MNVQEPLTKGCLWLLMAVLLLVLQACQMPPTEQQKAAEMQKKQVTLLLAKGQAALQADQLITPEDDCALTYFHAVQALVPEQAEAKAGIEAIFNRYLDLARTAHNSGDFTQALAMVDQAEKILPPTTISQEMRMQIFEEQARVAAAAKARKPANSKAAKGVEYLLSIDDLDKKNDKIQQRLALLAEHIRTVKAATIRIDARNDAEGRWIVEQLKHAEADYPFHAEIHKSQHPKIIVFKPEP